MNIPKWGSLAATKFNFFVNLALGIGMLVSAALIDAATANSRATVGLLVGGICCLFAASLAHAQWLNMTK